MRWTSSALWVAVLGVCFPASAAAAPPSNDHYLASETVIFDENDEYRPPTVDTREATTQRDLFEPSADGRPLGGGPPESTSCEGGPAYGRTVWYDIAPPVPGGVEINVQSGFDAVLRVFEWNLVTSRITREITCVNQSAGPVEQLRLERLDARRNYTVQVGGVGGTGGPLDFSVSYFRDTDGDGIFDELPDRCRRMPGISAFGGCPPLVRGAARVAHDRFADRMVLTRVAVEGVARGTRVEFRCRRCGRRVIERARRAGTVTLDAVAGRTVRDGDRLELRITHRRTKTGRFRYGAIGRTIKWRVVGTAFGRRQEICTRPDSRKRMRCP